MEIGFVASVIILLAGILLMGIGGIVFRWRAFTNQRAWEGATRPMLIIGLVTFAIGIVLVYVTYPWR